MPLKCVVFMALVSSGVFVYGQQQPTPKPTPTPIVITLAPQPQQAWYLRPEWVIVGITAVYTLITCLQWWTLRRQAKSLEQQIQDARTANRNAGFTAQNTLDAIEIQAKNMVEQTGLLRESADAARLSAEAADKNATALVNSERAWIMADLEFQRGALRITHTTNPVGEQTWAQVELHIRNCGPTPAWVFEQWIRLELSPIMLASDTQYLPPELPFGRGIENAVRMGRPTTGNYEILPLVEGGAPYIWHTEINDSGWPTEANDLKVYIYGVVKYRDAFNSLRETYFGYWVRDSNLERIPSEAYNRHT